MRIKPTIILLVLNIIVLAWIFLLKDMDSSGSESEDSLVLGKEIQNLDRLAIKRKNKDAIVLIKRGNQWRIDQPIHWLANDSAIEKIKSQLQFMEKGISFSIDEMMRSGRTLEEYGLEDPEVILTLYSSGDVKTLQIGDSSIIGNRVYVLNTDGKEIVAVSKELLDSVSYQLDDLRSQSIFNIPLYEIESLAIKTREPDISIRLIRNDDKWAFESPIIADADTDQINKALNELTRLKVTSFKKEGEEIASYGLDNPPMRVTLRGNNRQEVLLLGSAVSEDQSIVGNSFARMENSPTVFTISSVFFELLQEKWEKLREKKILYFNEHDLAAISISTQEKKVQLQKLETGPWQIMEQDKEENLVTFAADDVVIKKLMSDLSGFEAEGFVSDAPSEEDLIKYGLDKPLLIIELKGHDKIIMLVGKKVEKKDHYYAKLKNDQTVYEVSSKIFSILSVNPLYYKSRLFYQIPETARISKLSIVSTIDNKIIFNKELKEKEKWEDLFKEIPEGLAATLTSFFEELKEFKAKHYMSSNFDAEKFDATMIDGERGIAWQYKVECVVSLPGGDQVQKESRKYYFTTMKDGRVVGASSKEGITFIVNDSLSGIIKSLNR